jgi:hypothetical protein
MVVLWFKLPEVPAMVTVVVPVVAVALAVKVSVEVLVAGLLPNVAVTPLGNPDADKVTLPLKPPAGAITIVLALWPAWVRLKVGGLAEMV